MRISNLFAEIIATMVQAAAGEPLTFLRHNAVGWGTAQVFDGGPPVSGFGSTEGPQDPDLLFGAIDFTMTGSFGAAASATFRSSITSFEQSTAIIVNLKVGYSPSTHPGGDNPGGMAEGGIDSVIEFIVPINDLAWNYGLLIDRQSPFQGFSQAVFENLTTGELLFNLTEETIVEGATFRADIGDVMRLTTNLSGFGSMGPGSGRQYDSEAFISFTVPEPSTLLFLAAGAATVLRRNRPRSRSQSPGRKQPSPLKGAGRRLFLPPLQRGDRGGSGPEQCVTSQEEPPPERSRLGRAQPPSEGGEEQGLCRDRRALKTLAAVRNCA